MIEEPIERSVDVGDDLDERPCVILGAGFSRAISDSMPVMGELGASVLDYLALPEKTLAPFGGNLEQWMSYLSIDQPWLNTAENYENRGMFARVSEAVFEVIHAAEMETVTTELPPWLLRLAWTWCDQQARVFSFNYDTLLERAVGSVNRLPSLGDLYAAALDERTVGVRGITWGSGLPLGPLLSLYKLHGSTSWAFGGLDGPPNDRIVLTPSGLRWRPDPIEADPDLGPRELLKYDDLVPLIVPPTLTKGPFFSNLTLRAQWRRAAGALRSAHRLTVMGYSFPAGDLVAQQWVGTSFGGERMDVVDYERERPGHIREVLANSRAGEDLTGKNAIQNYVERECGDLVEWRIWGVGDEVGARASIKINGAEVLAGIDPNDPPWGEKEYDAVQRWIRARVEACGGENSVAIAQGPVNGSWEERHVVLPPGTRFEL